MSLSEQQLQLLKNSLEFISIYGWTEKPLLLGAQKANIHEDLIPILFPNGSQSAYKIFVDMINNEVLNQAAYLKNAPLRVHEKVEESILIRLKVLLPFKNCVSKAQSFHKNPKNTSISITTLYSIVDTLWFVCGDTSMDWNFYTKRTLLAYAYMLTISRWLKSQDSEDLEYMRPYVKEKLQSVMKISKVKKFFTPFFNAKK